MRILIDMNLSPRWVDIFFSHNIEAALITIDLKKTRLRVLPLF